MKEGEDEIRKEGEGEIRNRMSSNENLMEEKRTKKTGVMCADISIIIPLPSPPIITLPPRPTPFSSIIAPI
jgi:hypothetical protein